MRNSMKATSPRRSSRAGARLRNTWWIVDYNRQSLDAVIHEGLWAKIEAMFRNFGWDVTVLRHGKLQEKAFAEPGGAALRGWIETCPTSFTRRSGSKAGPPGANGCWTISAIRPMSQL